MIENDKNTDRILNYLAQTENEKLRTELQSAQLQLSQTSNIINQLMPVAKPAYITCSPYAAAMGYPYVNTGCGYGCNTGCGCCDRYKITVEEFVQEYPIGTYLITMNGHITCCRNGCIYDTFDPSNRIVWGAYKVN